MVLATLVWEVDMAKSPRSSTSSPTPLVSRIPLNHPALTFLDWVWSGVSWIWGAFLLGSLVAGPLFNLFTHGDLGLGDWRQWKVVTLATTFPVWSAVVLASVILITLVSYVAHRLRLSAQQALPRVHPAVSALVSMLALSAIVAAAIAVPSPKLVSSVCALSSPTSDASQPPHPYTAQELQMAYHFTNLHTGNVMGKGQTVAIVTSFYTPSLQTDLDNFSTTLGLPMTHIDIVAPLGLKAIDRSDPDAQAWIGTDVETAEIVHTVAPDAHIVIASSPVAETEGVTGLPDFLTLERYLVEHQIASVVVQPWGVSEYTLLDVAGTQEVQQWDAFFQDATVQQGITFIAGSGKTGGTDFRTVNSPDTLDRPTTEFPASDPWVLGVGGTSLHRSSQNGESQEVVWNRSGGGYSQLFAEPAYQQYLPPQVQTQLAHRRGVPDVAAATADPETGLRVYASGEWRNSEGTGASAAIWGGAIALANQQAGRSLGFVNPALYRLADSDAASQDFLDITHGTNCFHGIGYRATPGWDPASGLGTPIADNLLFKLGLPQ
jgi:subtilase family serine protease